MHCTLKQEYNNVKRFKNIFEMLYFTRNLKMYEMKAKA